MGLAAPTAGKLKSPQGTHHQPPANVFCVKNNVDFFPMNCLPVASQIFVINIESIIS